MNAGDLDKRVTIRRRTTIADPTGGTTDGPYADAFVRWASWRPLGGQAIAEAGQATNALSGTLKLRIDSQTKTISVADRIVFRSAPQMDFEIVGVGVPDRRDDSIALTLSARVGGS